MFRVWAHRQKWLLANDREQSRLQYYSCRVLIQPPVLAASLPIHSKVLFLQGQHPLNIQRFPE